MKHALLPFMKNFLTISADSIECRFVFVDVGKAADSGIDEND
jgi:hypothetical protein